VPAGPALAQQTVRETLQNVKQQTMQMAQALYNPTAKRYQDPETGRFVANPNVERVEKPVVKEVEKVQEVTKGTGNKIDSDTIKKYIRDIEGRTGRELPKNQIEKLKEALRNKEYKKMSPIETAKHRAEFDKVKNKVIMTFL